LRDDTNIKRRQSRGRAALKDETRQLARSEELISEERKRKGGKKGQKKEMLADKEDYSFPRFMSKPFYMWSIVC